MRKVLTFDDISLVPQYNNIKSRTEPNLQTSLTSNIKMDVPIVAANMDSVIGVSLAKVLFKHGSVPILHRFYKNYEELNKDVAELGGNCLVSIGVNSSLEEISNLSPNPFGVVIDIAHGHAQVVKELITKIKTTKRYRYWQVVAGNVCTAGGYIDLVNSGADGVKVGVGPGAACTTRQVTGFGVSQFTAIKDCAHQEKKYKIPIIADGGIRGSADIVKALAAGASSVMIGKLFACTEESASKKRQRRRSLSEVQKDTLFEANYRGQASRAFQEDFFGKVKKGTVPEGEEMWAPVTGSANALLDTLLGGIRSGMTYGGARNIKELQAKAEFVEVTDNYKMESNTRG